MEDPHAIALDLKDRYVRFLDRQGRLSYRGDIHDFRHALSRDTHIEYGEELGRGSFARVQAVYLSDERGARTSLVRRIYDMIDVATIEAQIQEAMLASAGSDSALSREGLSLKEALKTLAPQMHPVIRERIHQDRLKGQTAARAKLPGLRAERDAAARAAAGQFGRILGLSLDAGLEDAIAPIIGFRYETVSAGGQSAFTLYQPREDATLQQELGAAMRDLEGGSVAGAVRIADLVDATCALVGRTAAAGYIDADFKSPNIGVTRKVDGRGYAARTVDIGELRPVGALLEAFERHIAGNPEDAEFLPSGMIGTMLYMPSRKLDAFATRTPTQRQIAMLPGDDRTALALTLAADLFGLYSSGRGSGGVAGTPERRVMHERCRFIDPKIVGKGHPALVAYRPVLERAIAADLAGSEYPTGAFLQDLRTASGDVRAHARRAP